MSAASQLYQLQALDLEIESAEQALGQKSSQLGDNQVIVSATNTLKSEQQRLDELKHQQRSLEWDIDNLSSKMAKVKEQLFSGRISNPKELTNLQQEMNMLKTERDRLEDKALEIMGQVELAEASVVAASGALKKLDEEWHHSQQQLAEEIAQLKTRLAELNQNRQLMAGEIDAEAIGQYERLRKQKGQAVARVEQGICRTCRISLPSGKLQQARGDTMVYCSSCGRILYVP